MLNWNETNRRNINIWKIHSMYIKSNWEKRKMKHPTPSNSLRHSILLPIHKQWYGQSGATNYYCYPQTNICCVDIICVSNVLHWYIYISKYIHWSSTKPSTIQWFNPIITIYFTKNDFVIGFLYSFYAIFVCNGFLLHFKFDYVS